MLPETGGQTVALRVHGTMSEADVEAVSDLLARRTFGGRRANLLVEIAEGAGFSGARAIWADVELACKHAGALGRIAIVSDSKWMAAFVALDRPFARLFGVQERFFRVQERAEALDFVGC